VWGLCVVGLMGGGCGGMERGCVGVGNLRGMMKSSGGVVRILLGGGGRTGWGGGGHKRWVWFGRKLGGWDGTGKENFLYSNPMVDTVQLWQL